VHTSEELVLFDPEGTVTIYNLGTFYCYVCSSLADMKRLTQIVNVINPTGITREWSLSEAEAFPDGETNPHQCEKTMNRKHYLFECYPPRR
jgi:hypothetical protein